MMKAWGYREITSSELQVRGGADSAFSKAFEKVRNIIDFIGDYLPKLLAGVKDGFMGKNLI